ncbi:MAG TPA: tetratricopeptide repeat protein [Caulobacter sp.]|nr:tetratricopeptide repeat protein [Caulobacter sp.]
MLAPLLGCDTAPNLWGRKGDAACPRPQLATVASPQFNAQQQEIRTLRRGAFRGDFFSQLELGRRYEGQRAVDRNLEDPVEAAVWYAMALSNPDGYAQVSAGGRRASRDAQASSRFDHCRAVERRNAYTSLDRLLGRMDSGEQDKVRSRVVYVLSSQGAEGFRTLARIHDDGFGIFGEPSDNREAMGARGRPYKPGTPSVINLFPRNDVDAYLYNYLAVQTGDIGAYVMLKDFERSSAERGGFGSFVESKAKRWTPPYEFYPPDAPGSGVPHVDESNWRDEATDAALDRLRELPFVHIAEALTYLRVTPSPVKREEDLYPGDVQTFQQMLGREPTGRFTSIEKVRAIQYAAVNGSPRAQLVLAVMYSEGVGVRRDYARAFYWYSEADKQGSAEAKYAMSTFFSLGMDGVADQSKADAVVYQVGAALSGFKPSAGRLQQVLSQVSRENRQQQRRGEYR